MQSPSTAATKTKHSQHLVNILEHVAKFEYLQQDNKTLIITYGPPGVGKSVVLEQFLASVFSRRKPLTELKAWYNGNIDHLVKMHSAEVQSWIHVENELNEKKLQNFKLANSQLFINYVTRKRTQRYFAARKERQGLDELNDTLMQAAMELGAGVLLETTGAYGRVGFTARPLVGLLVGQTERLRYLHPLSPSGLDNIKKRLRERRGQLSAHNPEELFRDSYYNLLYEILPSYQILADVLYICDNNNEKIELAYLDQKGSFSSKPVSLSGAQRPETLELVSKLNKIHFIRELGKADCTCRVSTAPIASCGHSGNGQSQYPRKSRQFDSHKHLMADACAIEVL